MHSLIGFDQGASGGVVKGLVDYVSVRFAPAHTHTHTYFIGFYFWYSCLILSSWVFIFEEIHELSTNLHICARKSFHDLNS